jgi:RNA polymerase sigma-70 factor (ECF subfamily)
MAALEGLLAEDVVSYSDGGGLVRMAGVPVSGRERVKTFVEAVSTYFWKGVSVAFVEVNGQGCAAPANPELIGEIGW